MLIKPPPLYNMRYENASTGRKKSALKALFHKDLMPFPDH
jgi:hypothetical protein